MPSWHAVMAEEPRLCKSELRLPSQENKPCGCPSGYATWRRVPVQIFRRSVEEVFNWLHGNFNHPRGSVISITTECRLNLLQLFNSRLKWKVRHHKHKIKLNVTLEAVFLDTERHAALGYGRSCGHAIPFMWCCFLLMWLCIFVSIMKLCMCSLRAVIMPRLVMYDLLFLYYESSMCWSAI